MARISIKCESY